MNGLRPLSGREFGLSDATDLAQLLRAVADPSRLQIIHLLSRGPMSPMAIREELGRLAQPTVQHHLKLLRVAGLASVEGHGADTVYRLNRGALRSLLDLARPGGGR